MRTLLVPFGSGLVFAIGLGIGGMSDPRNVLAFLDVAGAWDPALLFVMVGAIAVHALFLASRGRSAFAFGPGALATALDRRLLAGAAIFGLGWGLGGYCPGPAVMALSHPGPGPLVFATGLVAGMALQRWLARTAAPASSCDQVGQPAP